MCCDFYVWTSEETAESQNEVTFCNTTSPHSFILHFKPHFTQREDKQEAVDYMTRKLAA